MAMDRITKSLLDEFSRERDLSKLPEDKQFEHFAIYLTVQRFLSETLDTYDPAGSGGDTGIDGIAIIVNGSLVDDPDLIEEFVDRNGYLDVTFVFVQAERSAHFEASKMGVFLFGVEDFFRAEPSFVRNEAVASAATVMAAIYHRSSKFRRGNPSCKLYSVTTGTWVGDANLEARRRAGIAGLMAQNLFRDVEFVPIDANAIHRLYRESKNSIPREFEFSQRTVVPNIPGVNEAYLGLLPASEFINLIQDVDGEILKGIFYDNVRDWQDYNPVNTEIKETLSSDILRARLYLLSKA
jgi:hypothetical protein